MKKLKWIALGFTVALLLAALAQAQTFSTLYNFTGGSDGSYPYGGVVKDSAGNLYGTTEQGGSNYSTGTVYELTTDGTEVVLHSFDASYHDGFLPYAPLIIDGNGNLYGTTSFGGSGGGIVFRLSPPRSQSETILHAFTGSSTDGCFPYQGVVITASGTIYGTTIQCGANNLGTVFEISPSGEETLLHSFGGARDGQYPYYGRLLADKQGNLYGLTEEGGRFDDGVLYKLSIKKKLTLLHTFAGGAEDGCLPFGTPAVDSVGNFYGTTQQCGAYGGGTVWKINRDGKETILHSFRGGASDGEYPVAGVTLDSQGNIYGVTQQGGAAGVGTVYMLTKNGALTLLHSFDNSDGAYPFDELLRDTQGKLYGTTAVGGANTYGTVWSLTP